MKFRLLMLLLLSAVPGMADGTFKSKRILKPVEIPGQVAALSHSAGKETLTIWNTVQSEEQELAWMLPLPTQPEVIQETSPEAMRILQLMCAPTVKSGEREVFSILLMVMLLAAGAWLLLRRRPAEPRLSLSVRALRAILPFGFLVFMVFYAGLSSKFRGRSAPPVAGVRVLAQQQTGSYETTVISGDSAKALNDWLTAGGFPAFAGGELQVVEDYIAKDWVFLCAKLKTGVSGPAATHPITVRFAAVQPVYPMRLTAAAGTVPVELFLIGDRPSSDPSQRMQRQLTVTMDPRTVDLRSYTYTFNHHQFRSIKSRLNIAREFPEDAGQVRSNELNGQPFVPKDRDLLLDSLLEHSALTRMTATFTPRSDWNDISFAWTDEIEEVPPHMTREAFIDRVVSETGVWAAAVFLGVGLVAHASTGRGRRPHVRWPLAATVVFAGTLLYSGWKLSRGVVVVDAAHVMQNGSDDSDSVAALFDKWLESMAKRE